MNEHLKPDEREMLERAEKATKGLWKRGKKAVSRCPLCDGEGEVDSIDINGDGWTALAQTYGIGPMIEDNAAFIIAAPSDLPTILTRLANEREKLAIAMGTLGNIREYWNGLLNENALHDACEHAVAAADRAITRINELERQSWSRNASHDGRKNT